MPSIDEWECVLTAKQVRGLNQSYVLRPDLRRCIQKYVAWVLYESDEEKYGYPF